MSDYIKRKDVINAFYTATGDGDKAEWCVGVIQSIPSDDVVERKMGVWREDIWLTTKGYFCSECHAFTTNPSMFCPNCGAEMRKPEKEAWEQ